MSPLDKMSASFLRSSYYVNSISSCIGAVYSRKATPLGLPEFLTYLTLSFINWFGSVGAIYMPDPSAAYTNDWWSRWVCASLFIYSNSLTSYNGICLRDVYCWITYKAFITLECPILLDFSIIMLCAWFFRSSISSLSIKFLLSSSCATLYCIPIYISALRLFSACLVECLLTTPVTNSLRSSPSLYTCSLITVSPYVVVYIGPSFLLKVIFWDNIQFSVSI